MVRLESHSSISPSGPFRFTIFLILCLRVSVANSHLPPRNEHPCLRGVYSMATAYSAERLQQIDRPSCEVKTPRRPQPRRSWLWWWVSVVRARGVISLHCINPAPHDKQFNSRITWKAPGHPYYPLVGSPDARTGVTAPVDSRLRNPYPVMHRGGVCSGHSNTWGMRLLFQG